MDNPRTFDLVVFLYEEKFMDAINILEQMQDEVATSVLMIILVTKIHHVIVKKLLEFCTNNNKLVIKNAIMNSIINGNIFIMLEYLIHDGYKLEEEYINELKKCYKECEGKIANTNTNITHKILLYTRMQNIKQLLINITKI